MKDIRFTNLSDQWEVDGSRLSPRGDGGVAVVYESSRVKFIVAHK